MIHLLCKGIADADYCKDCHNGKRGIRRLCKVGSPVLAKDFSPEIIPARNWEIGNQQENQTQTEKDYPDIRNYIAENYEVDKNKIIFQ